MKKNTITIFAALLILLTFSGIAFPWEIKSHLEMSNMAVNISSLQSYVENNLRLDFISKQFLGPTHSRGNLKIQEFSNDKYNTATEWITHGDGAEDEYPLLRHYSYYRKNMRSNNHFYNPFWDNVDIYPYPDDGWGNDWNFQEGGLYDDVLELGIFVGKPSLKWAYDGCPETPPNSYFTRSEDNYFSWVYARKYFYAALSGDSTKVDGIGGIVGKINMNEQEKDRCFALLFRSLGQLMHLVQDAGVPEHARNDAHILSGMGFGGFWPGFEYHAAEQNFNNPSWASVIPWQSIVKSDNPILDFFDAHRSGEGYSSTESTGLAEFSNFNFLTKDSIADNLMYDYCAPNCTPSGHERHRFFTFPRINENLFTIEQGYRYDTYYYWSGEIIDPLRISGTQASRLAKRRWYNNVLLMYGWNDYTTEDPKIWDDYLNALIPKCIGYSAALLDYFFRGDLDIRKASVRLGTGLTITGIDFEVKNATIFNEQDQTIEPFQSGTIDISCQYFLDGQEDPNYVVANGVYTISDASDVINSDYVPISVTLPGDKIIPFGAKDITFTLIFRGKLGNEEGAVVAKYHAFNEHSRIAYHYQPRGFGNPSNVYTVLPDGSDEKQITTITTPRTHFFSPAWSPDGTLLAFEYERCVSDSNPDPWCDGEYIRDIHIIDMNSQATYPDNLIQTLHLYDPDNWEPPINLPLALASFSPGGDRIVAIASDIYSALVTFNVVDESWNYVSNWEYWFLEGKDVKGSRPAWSPKSDEIAYYIHRGKDPDTNTVTELKDICIIHPDGSGDRWLTRDSYFNTQPSWSPDGQWLVFVSDRDGGGTMDIWIMDRLGQQRQMIRDCGGDCWSPSFSPDGLKIAFQENGDIYTINLDGSGLTQVTYTGDSYSPEWSPFLEEAPTP